MTLTESGWLVLHVHVEVIDLHLISETSDDQRRNKPLLAIV